jgi:hypothetical protein
VDAVTPLQTGRITGSIVSKDVVATVRIRTEEVLINIGAEFLAVFGFAEYIVL